MDKLPEKKGEKLVVWSDYEKDAEGPVRIVLVAATKSRWSMHTEGGILVEAEDPNTEVAEDEGSFTYDGGAPTPCEEYEDGKLYEWREDADAASFVHGIGDHDWSQGLNALILEVPKVMLELSRLSLSNPQKVQRPTLSNSASGSVVSRIKGNKKLIVPILGDNKLGEPIVEIHTNKPMNRAEWMVSIGALAEALVNFREDCGR